MTRISKKALSLVLCLLMVLSMFGPVFGATTTSDYGTHWAKNAIEAAREAGVMKGYPDGTFRPNNAITRAEFFSLVNNTFGYTAISATTFTDVPTNAWYAPVIAKAKAAGYILGYPDGGIHPNSNITRQEVAVVMTRIKSLTATGNTLGFTDAYSIASWSKQSVIAVFEAMIMTGYPDGSFKPKAFITRAEALVTIGNSFAYVSTVPPVVTPPVIPAPVIIGGGGGGGSSTPAAVEVTMITVTGAGAVAVITADNGTLQMLAVVSPTNATNPAVTWSVAPGTGSATISVDGLLTAVTNGTVTVTATSVSTGSITGTLVVTLSNQLSSDATLLLSSTVKGETLVSVGTSGAVIATATGGAVTITAIQAADTTNATTFVTSFVATGAGATVSRVVKYASADVTTNFEADTVYTTAAITNGDFFIIKITAQDASIRYYKVVVTITP